MPDSTRTPWRRSERVPIPCSGMVAMLDVSLVVFSLVAMLLAANVDQMPRGLDGFLSVRITLKNLLLLGVLALGSLAIFRAAGLYNAARLRRWSEETRRVVTAVVPVTLLAGLFPVTSRSGAFERLSPLYFWLAASAVLVAARSVRALVAGRRFERLRVLIVGTGPQALRIHRELCSDLRGAYSVLGFIDTATVAPSAFLRRRMVGTLEDLEQILARHHVDEVYVGLPVKSHYPQIQETLHVCERVGVKATYRADIFDTDISRPCVPASGARPLVEMQVAPEGWALTVKRALDVAGAATGLLLLAPLLLVAAIAVKASGPGPVIFAQERYGLNRRRFRMLKFRTMVAGADRLQAALESRNEAVGPVFKMANDPRVTRVGRLLRRTSIDELPQLINVLRGDMSLVGPRPLPLRDVARITRPADMRRFSVRPGLTCLWQISGRSRVGFDEWVKLDLQYIDRWSIGLDLEVLARTVPAVLRGTGAA